MGEEKEVECFEIRSDNLYGFRPNSGSLVTIRLDRQGAFTWIHEISKCRITALTKGLKLILVGEIEKVYLYYLNIVLNRNLLATKPNKVQLIRIIRLTCGQYYLYTAFAFTWK